MTYDNDNPSRAGFSSPDAHGQAALLLVESLIHGLRESGVLTSRTLVEIAERATDVQREKAEETVDDAASMWLAHSLILAIAKSLKTDDVGGSPPLRPVP